MGDPGERCNADVAEERHAKSGARSRPRGGPDRRCRSAVPGLLHDAEDVLFAPDALRLRFLGIVCEGTLPGGLAGGGLGQVLAERLPDRSRSCRLALLVIKG